MSDTAPRKHRPTREDSRERLLDAAEQLFADRGFDGVPVRDITEHAGTRLAEINDQFGGKQELFEAVVRRRAAVLNAQRLARLQALPRQGSRTARMAALVDAFARPLLERSQEGDGWRAYLRLMALLHASRSPVLLLIADEFLPVVQACSAELRDIFPGMEDRAVLNAYGFMVAAVMAVFSENLRLDFYSGGQLRSGDFDDNYQDMCTFVEAGLQAMGRAGKP